MTHEILDEEAIVSVRNGFAAAVLCLATAVTSAQDHPLLDMMAQAVIKKYQGATCEELWQQRGKPKSQREQELVQLLKGDPTLRTEFIDQVAGPVVNKMFECGMVP